MNTPRDTSRSRSEYFILGGSDDRKGLLAEIGKNFSLGSDSSREMEQVFLDTFDHRLYRNGLLLSREGEQYVLRNPGAEMDLSSRYSGNGDHPRFWQDFPESPLRDEIRPIIDIRALIPLISVGSSVRQYNIVNEDEKTVVHLNFEAVTVNDERGNGNTVHLLEVAPVRGYPDDFNDMISRITEIGLEREEGNILSLALAAADMTAGGYSSKTDVELEPDMPSATALKVILKSLLETMKMNEEGIVLDIDTEFLHDFRVAVRRTRSALTLIKGVFPESVKEKFKTDFTRIGKKSNELRDLDIYLLRKDKYTEMLPPNLRPGLEHLYEIISSERGDALCEFVRELSSDTYRHSIGSWENFLNEQFTGEGALEGASAPVIGLARKRIRKRYKKAVRLGKEINEKSPDVELHSLRIECKKLRYYLEFFESLFPESEIKAAIKHLKILQDNLGDFNDLRVQQERLRGYISKMDSSERAGYTIAAAGGLISRLYDRQKEIRSQFSERFEEFSAGEMKELFEKLFYGN
jgi:CHAD domain-containing protein